MKYKYLTLLMLGLCSVADAQVKKTDAKEAGKPAKDAAAKPSTVSDQIEVLINEANDVQGAFMKKVRAEKDKAKAMELYRNGRPDMKPFLKQILDLSKQEPKSAGAAKGLAWGYGAFLPEDKATAFDLLIKHHVDSDVMLSVLNGMSRSRTPDIKAIRGVMAASKNDKIRQSAVQILASIFSRDPSKAEESLALYKQLEAWPKIAESNPKLLAHAKQQIFIVENLSIGKEAPDIVGTDHEDKEFKLSDYRGKVVMIDFWGIW